ncbi:L-2-hydroxyglutarate oxidase [Streptoalloteichus tenebrarius]|uniref:L-2-hydroxyglutarate oxidase n=1 Tax=Streptoalloteichus tenebrarius (strain ATCC 17920 / DSM 40477 / JCM 4838 / CBS 697.72 / NBRC 16177 / NCIMB 11028 / NRRL B-12390 / A12253. 1 / ISP 5477) TaxID=1933 RepID=A0ABT1HRH6_STRSD|nr:L-2-hydroxyglutarate oxidase [Streptoalloteichus tenebrarius]MCP2258117.1 L-2-hydroxyglutarate oxidase [Streptoalloteichus tenebrarius]BFF01791.1 L-2-hydroxyglutarate oxidase [Streptoalloteichus tenebrarius]
MQHVAVVGGGIVGLAVAHELAAERGVSVTVLEKETAWAAHQTGHNSGVIHAGLYYKPGSHKARMAVAGNRSMVRFAEENGVPVEVCGKLVVATEPDELPRLQVLAERAEANGVPAKRIEAAEAREYEPEVNCLAALRVETTGIVDYGAVCQALVRRLGELGAELRTGAEVLGVRGRGGRVELATPGGIVRADALVNCAGLHSDRIARLAGLRPAARIVPFRGEYYELRHDRRHLVRGLIYPVPDPTLPFLGVHLTRMIDGSVHAGPNAVLALRREGYRWRDVSLRDLAEVARFPGSWRLARKYARTGVDEVLRSFSQRRFAASLARLVPAVRQEDLVRAEAGVRAQAMLPDGSLVDDFLFEMGPRQVHVLNAPSPAATASLEIARHVADRVMDVL